MSHFNSNIPDLSTILRALFTQSIAWRTIGHLTRQSRVDPADPLNVDIFLQSRVVPDAQRWLLLYMMVHAFSRVLGAGTDWEDAGAIIVHPMLERSEEILDIDPQAGLGYFPIAVSNYMISHSYGGAGTTATFHHRVTALYPLFRMIEPKRTIDIAVRRGAPMASAWDVYTQLYFIRIPAFLTD